MQHPNSLLRNTRYMRQADCRTQPLRAGRGMGPAQRVCGYAVVGPLCAHLHSQDERRALLPGSTQQSHQDGSARPESILQQPRTTRFWWSVILCSTRYGFRGCIPGAFCTWYSPIAGSSDEPTADIPQPPIIVWLVTVHASISVARAVDAATSCYAKFSQHWQHWNRRRAWCQKCPDLC